MSHEFDLGKNAKFCIIAIILFPSILTCIILHSEDVSLLIKTVSLVGTMIVSYLMAVIVQDYIYVKKRSDKTQCRYDVNLLEPLLERLEDKDVGSI